MIHYIFLSSFLFMDLVLPCNSKLSVITGRVSLSTWNTHSLHLEDSIENANCFLFSRAFGLDKLLVRGHYFGLFSSVLFLEQHIQSMWVCLTTIADFHPHMQAHLYILCVSVYSFATAFFFFFRVQILNNCHCIYVLFQLPLLIWKRFAFIAAMCILAVRAVIFQLAFYLHMQVLLSFAYGK